MPGCASGSYLRAFNNDMRLEPAGGRGATMAAYLDNSPPDVVCAGSLILNWDGSRGGRLRRGRRWRSTAWASSPGEPVSRTASTSCRTQERNSLPLRGSDDGRTSLAYLETRSYDNNYFAYLEDVDFGWRLWGARLPGGLLPERHHNYTTFTTVSSRHYALLTDALCLQERNALATIVKNYEDATMARVLPAALLLAVKRFALQSGFAREDFRFGRRTSARVPHQPQIHLLGRGFRRVRRHHGMIGVGRKVLVGEAVFRPLSAPSRGATHAADARRPVAPVPAHERAAGGIRNDRCNRGSGGRVPAASSRSVTGFRPLAGAATDVPGFVWHPLRLQRLPGGAQGAGVTTRLKNRSSARLVCGITLPPHPNQRAATASRDG